MIEITLQKVPDQKFTVTLAGQKCDIRLFQSQFTDDLFMDLTVNDAILFNGVQVRTGNKIVRDAYLGFSGDLVFLDSQGSDDPLYTGFGDRWDLYYMTEDELNV